METQKHFTSKAFCCCGAMMAIVALLMFFCAGTLYGALCGASALCLFGAALNFRYMENKKESEETKDE